MDKPQKNLCTGYCPAFFAFVISFAFLGCHWRGGKAAVTNTDSPMLVMESERSFSRCLMWVENKSERGEVRPIVAGEYECFVIELGRGGVVFDASRKFSDVKQYEKWFKKNIRRFQGSFSEDVYVVLVQGEEVYFAQVMEIVAFLEGLGISHVCVQSQASLRL